MNIQERFLEAPHRSLVALSAPVMASLLVEPVAGIVDTAFVERLGASHAAALGAATALLSSLLWIFNFLGVGTQTSVAQAAGADAGGGARRAVTIAVYLSLLLGFVVAGLVFHLARPLVVWMSADAALQESAVTYLRIRLLGAPAGLLLLTCFGALRGRADMRTPLRIAVGVSVLNVILDAILIFGTGPIPALGIAGAAWATTASQGLGALAALRAVARTTGFERPKSWSGAKQLLLVGRDMVLRTGALLFFLLVSTRTALSMGVDAGAAHQAIRQVWLATAFILDAFAASAQSLIGTFMGAGRPLQARHVARVACGWALGTGVFLTVSLVALEGAFAELLVPETAREAFHAAWIVCILAQPLNALAFVTDGIHMGTADYAYLRNAMLASTLLGLVGLATIGPSDSLDDVWWVAALWITVRATLGVLRIWPGFGHAPARAGID